MQKNTSIREPVNEQMQVLLDLDHHEVQVSRVEGGSELGGSI